MGEKISIIILKVDLDCRRCYKKISKTICKLQERENIQTVAYDEKNNTVTISGPFDPKKLCKKLCCKACKVIKDIQIKEKEKEKPKDTKPVEPKKDKPKDTKPDEPKEDKPKTLKPDPPPTEPVKAGPVHVAQEPELGCQPVWPGSGCGCGCRPWYYGDGRCPLCGRVYGWVPRDPPPVVYVPPVVYPPHCGGYKTCEFFYEEEPQSSCSIM